MGERGRVAVVTGSSRGVGLGIAQRLAHEGYSVMLNYASDDAQAERALAACGELGPHVRLCKADVSRADDVARLVQLTVDEFGALDVLVNNAAKVVDRPALEMTEADWDAVVDVNLKGAFLCAQFAARQMVAQESGGAIINIGAATGIRGRRNGVNTCASKAGLMLLTQCLALELAPAVRVNTIIPGLTLTDETERRFGLSDPEVRRVREEQIPLGRIGTPADVADAVMLLLSGGAGFITGQRIAVDGGQYMW